MGTSTHDRPWRRARFANRQNGGADFRLVLPDRTAVIRRVALRRL